MCSCSVKLNIGEPLTCRPLCCADDDLDELLGELPDDSYSL